MLRLWSQVARPQLSCNCFACSSSVAAVLARRTASATTRRRLKLVDAFTILLAPVFATAFVADTNWKDRRRIEWDKKIAEVEGEVERLQRQESQILRSSRRGGNAQQKRVLHTRSYSTDVQSRVLEDDTNDDMSVPPWRSRESEVEEDDGACKTSARALQEPLTVNPQMTADTRDALRRIEKLVALKLAIRMVIHVNVGASPRFKDTNPGYTHDSKKPPGDFNHLIDQLKIIRRSLRQLNSARERPNVCASQKLPRNEQAVIDVEIRQAAHDFRLGNLSVRGLVTRISNSIIRSPEPPSVKAYVPLMTAFSRARLDELTYLVMAAIDEGRLTLSNHSLFNIIWQYGKNRDAHRFDVFLNSVTKADAAIRYTETWERRMINEVEVPCPRSNDSRLLQILIYTALKCNQPHRAEAWTSQLKHSDSPAKHTSHVLRNFMKFYATHRDWQRGKAWLSTALDWSVSLGPNVIRDLQRVVFAMLELCVACGKQEAYSCILEAAVHARIGVFAAEPELTFIERSKSILAEWHKLHNSMWTCAEEDCSSTKSKAQGFCDEVTSKLDTLGLSWVSPRFKWPTPLSASFENPAPTDESASKWRELCKQQAAELEKLKAQLAETRWLLTRNARQDIEEHGSQGLVGPIASAAPSAAPLLPAYVNFAPSSLAEQSILPSGREQPKPPALSTAPTVPSEANQESKTARSDGGWPDLGSEQMWDSVSAQVADPRATGSKSSGLEDLITASSSGEGHFSPNENFESLNAGGIPKHESATKNMHAEPAPYPGNHRSLGPLAASSDPVQPCQRGGATDEPTMQAFVSARTNASGAPNDGAQSQTTQTSNQARQGRWISFLKMPRTRQISAHATLRYIHLQSPEPPKPVEHLQEEGVKGKERKPSTITLRLSQLPATKAVKFVNGEFIPRKWDTGKAEADAARMKARSISNGRGGSRDLFSQSAIQIRGSEKGVSRFAKL